MSKDRAAPLFPVRFNFRDLGGLPAREGREIARGRLFRGASLHELAPAEVERLRALGVRTVLDLRTRGEFEHPSYPPLSSLETHSVPLFEELPDLSGNHRDVSGMMARMYMDLLEVGSGGIRAALDLLAQPDRYPAAFFCAAGKDRTGVLAAIVLTLTGVEAEEIVRDYALTDSSMDEQLRWVAENDPGRWDVVQVSVYRAHAETMARFLAAAEERYGGLGGYVREIGVPAATTEAVAANLLA